MRFFTFAAIAGAAVAQDSTETLEFVNETPIADAVNREVLCEGEIGEWLHTGEDGARTAGMYVQFKTSCNECWFENGAVVQNWIETPSKENPGKFDGMLCTANWEKSTQYSVNHQVANYINTEPLSDNTKGWADYTGWATTEEEMFWSAPDDDVEADFKSEFNNKPKFSAQTCTAIRTLYGETADGSFNTELGGTSGMYWDWKNNNMPWTFTSGYRVWTGPDEDAPYTYASAGETSYTLADHGFTDTTPPPAEDDTTDDTTGSGAAALLAAATTLAAVLVF